MIRNSLCSKMNISNHSVISFPYFHINVSLFRHFIFDHKDFNSLCGYLSVGQLNNGKWPACFARTVYLRIGLIRTGNWTGARVRSFDYYKMGFIIKSSRSKANCEVIYNICLKLSILKCTLYYMHYVTTIVLRIYELIQKKKCTFIFTKFTNMRSKTHCRKNVFLKRSVLYKETVLVYFRTLN